MDGDFIHEIDNLIFERHSREVLAFENILERYHILERGFSTLMIRIRETLELISSETDIPLATIQRFTKKLEVALYKNGDESDHDDEDGSVHFPSKFYLSMYQMERELQHLRVQNEGLTKKLMELSEERAREMNASLLSRRAVENLPKYRNSNEQIKVPQIVSDAITYRPHAGAIIDMSMYENFLLTAGEDGYAIFSLVPGGQNIELALNAPVQACDVTFTECYTCKRNFHVVTCSGSSVRVYVVSPCLSESPALLTHFTIASSPPTCVRFVTSTRLAIGTDDGRLRIYDIAMRDQESSEREIRKGGWLLCEERGCITSMSSSSLSSSGLDPRRIALADSHGYIYVFDVLLYPKHKH